MKKIQKRRIAKITNELIGNAYLNLQKAKLYLLRGDAYAELFRGDFKFYLGTLFDPKDDPGGLGPLPGVDDRKEISEEYPFTDKSEFELKSIIQTASAANILNSNCKDYEGLIKTSSNNYNIPDPLLLLSIMQQESSCAFTAVGKNNKGEGVSFGLMQITEPTFKDVCETESLAFEDIKGSGNVANNIECGAKILKNKYDSYRDGRVSFYLL